LNWLVNTEDRIVDMGRVWGGGGGNSMAEILMGILVIYNIMWGIYKARLNRKIPNIEIMKMDIERLRKLTL
jgi:hypothetical protein